MHENYEDSDDEDYDEHDYDSHKDEKYKWYYKFDVGPDNPMSKWLDEIIKDFINNPVSDINIVSIPGFDSKKFPVSSWNPNADKGNSLQYLGSNYQGSPIWKKKYFAVDKINNEYKLHLQKYASHFLKQPVYYKGLFDILN
jgi:hypothetical protein